MTPASREIRPTVINGKPMLRGILLFLGLLLLLGVTAYVYQLRATTTDLQRYPAPGEYYAIGAHELHLHCLGEGSPTVLLEAGHSMNALVWAWVQRDLATSTRVCAYDRAGYGWSEAGPQARDAVRITSELRALVEAANLPGPYVLVGHSLGGLYVRQFALAYPEAVLGLVLVDARRHDETLAAEASQAHQQGLLTLNLGLFLAQFGVTRFLGDMSGALDNLPPDVQVPALALSVPPKHWRTALSEAQAVPETEAQLRAQPSLGRLPLLVLSSEYGLPGMDDAAAAAWHSVQAAQTELSSQGQYGLIGGSDHLTLLTEQAHAEQIADAVQLFIADLPTLTGDSAQKQQAQQP